MTTNPFHVLQIDSQATQAEILRATADAMKSRQASIQEIAEAQKTLFNPETRAAAEFLFVLESYLVSERDA